MEELLIPLEYRQDETRESPGMLAGVLMTYGERANDRPEMFEMNALHWDASGIVIREQHKSSISNSPGDSIPPRTGITDQRTSAEHHQGAGYSRGHEGTDPTVFGPQCEFRAEKESRRGGLRVISKAYLGGAGLVDSPSYKHSLVEVREHNGLTIPGALTLWL